MPLEIRSWLNEVLDLHLLKFSSTEDEISGSDLIAECLTDLCDSEWDFFSRRPHDIREIHEDTLCCLWSKVDDSRRVISYSLECLEHKIERANFCPVKFSTIRTC